MKKTEYTYNIIMILRQEDNWKETSNATQRAGRVAQWQHTCMPEALGSIPSTKINK